MSDIHKGDPVGVLSWIDMQSGEDHPLHLSGIKRAKIGKKGYDQGISPFYLSYFLVILVAIHISGVVMQVSGHE